MKVSHIYIFALLFFFSCNSFFKKNKIEDAIARVNDNYLYSEDVNKILPEGASKADSIIIVSDYINKWASRLLLLENAKINLPENQQEGFNDLVKQYETDLYTKTYLEALVKRSIDTSVSHQQAINTYEINKESFKLNDELLQFRYINLPQNSVNLQEIKTKFKTFEKADKRFLDSISVQFNSYSLNDSVWVKASQVLNKIPTVDQTNKNQLLKKSNFIQLKDSLNLYLIQINDVLLRNDYAPLEYVKPTLNQIIINRRKLDLIKNIEKDILQDATKNKEFEIYK